MVGREFTALLEDLVGSLRKEKQKLEEDAWRYAAPRSQPKLINQVRQIPGEGVLPSYATASELLLVLALM